MNIYKITLESEISIPLEELSFEDIKEFDPEDHFDSMLYPYFEVDVEEFDDGEYELSNSKTGPFDKQGSFCIDEDAITYTKPELAYHNQYMSYDVTIVYYMKTDMTEDLIEAYERYVLGSIDTGHGCYSHHELVGNSDE